MQLRRATPTGEDRSGTSLLSRVLRAMGALGVGIFLATAFTPFPNILAYWTSIPDDLGPADAIVVLGAGGATPPGLLGGSSLRKALYGVQLYQRGLAPLLVLSGGRDENGQRGEVSLRVQLARDHGIPREAIAAETHPQAGDEPTTYGEGAQVRTIVAGRGVRTLLLVTDSQHMRRARRVFEKLGFSVLAAPMDEISLDATLPEERLKLLRWISEEFFARLYYRVSGYM